MLSRICLYCFLVWLAAAPVALAGSDAATVPAHRIPWSGYWWPVTEGKLAIGYSAEPSPLERYDAFVHGYYPGAAMEAGLAREYNPEVPAWHGLCDAWAAASILEPEPAQPGARLGIPFRVGDKKGLLTAFYRRNYAAIMYGSAASLLNPGGVGGFHQILINYISHQGLPIVIDADPGPEVWSYPVYRYEMGWTDIGQVRHVTCTIWMANNSVPPDFVGTSSTTLTYTYELELDPFGELRDAPGRWTGASVDDHPDFMWFPTSAGNNHAYLNGNVVRQIVDSTATLSDDRFEPNTTRETAHEIDEPVKGRYYWGNSQNSDWYRVSLGRGDDFNVHLRSPVDDLDVRMFNAGGGEVGDVMPGGVRVRTIHADGAYYIRVLPGDDIGVYYNIAFYGSPADLIPHVAAVDGWTTSVTLAGRDPWAHDVRLNLFTPERAFLGSGGAVVPEDTTISADIRNIFGESVESAGTVKLINLDANIGPHGFFSYSRANQLVNLPFGVEPDHSLLVPHISRAANRFTGIALANANIAADAAVRMRLYNDDGEMLGESDFSIGPGRNKVGLPEHFGAAHPDATWILFTADRPLQGIVLWWVLGEGKQAGLGGIPLLRSRHAGRVLYLPHIASGLWTTETAIVNPGDTPATVAVTGYTTAGRPEGTRTFGIPPRGAWRGEAWRLFGNQWDPEMAWARMEANSAVSGYQLFGLGTDGLAAMPLQTEDDATTELLVPYIPDLDHDWLGLAFLNPEELKTDFYAIPLDAAGNNLPGDRFLWYNVPHGLQGSGKAVGLIEELFPGLPPETRMLRIISQRPMLGLGIYGESIRGRAVDVMYLHE